MPTDLTIRTATADDAEVLARFNEAMAEETEGKTLDPDTVRAGVKALLDDPTRGFYLVAVREEAAAGAPAEKMSERIRGALMITTEWSDWRNGVLWWIQSVYVRPEARRTGVYTSLHRAVRQRARNTDEVRGLRLYVERGNETARETYEALGMTETAYRMYEEML
jgi:GNAT superfamily N-acetyltransferase